MTTPSYLSGLLAEQNQQARRQRADDYRTGAGAAAVLRRRAALMRQASAVRIRPIRVSDVALLEDAFARLSPESRRTRFMAPKPRLTPRELRYLTDVDHHDHEALVAVRRSDGRGLGVARYIRYKNDPQVADVAVTVVDDWQSRGLGTRLAGRLVARARSEGVRRFSALMLAENTRAVRLMERVPGTLTLLSAEHEELTYELLLT